MKYILLLLVSIVIFAPKTFAAEILMNERTSLFEKHHYESWSGKAEMDYYVLKPLNYDPQKFYPLVVNLHGGTGRALGAYALSAPQLRENFPAFILVPHVTGVSSWEVEAYEDFWPIPNTHVMRIIKTLMKEYSIDENRIYLTGHSMGGFGTFGMVAQYPDFFAVAAPLCGGGDISDAPKMVDTQMWIFHGNKDRNISVEKSRNISKAIAKAGGTKVYYTEYPIGHDVWTLVYDKFYFWSALFKQRREIQDASFSKVLKDAFSF
ncbi:MAG: hypothetical protein DI586_08680 [Micavibrio aeruginosavorus]|uniref:Phospholipase n=1 Tax=Micavibrio aeruginosavorus TaxID=349221 RepID=A0A2W5FFS1_9BACT|nr:MAG: hypothetical protein DI586_08680 [Micavibrio aeruginosavorus]